MNWLISIGLRREPLEVTYNVVYLTGVCGDICNAVSNRIRRKLTYTKFSNNFRPNRLVGPAKFLFGLSPTRQRLRSPSRLIPSPSSKIAIIPRGAITFSSATVIESITSSSAPLLYKLGLIYCLTHLALHHPATDQFDIPWHPHRTR